MHRDIRQTLATFLVAVLVGVLAAPDAAARPRVVPPGFVPSATSWTTAQQGWVLGFAPCPDGQCPVLVRTWDGGAKWWRANVPPLPLPTDNRRVRVHFANGGNGLMTDGTSLYATHTAGLFWRRVDLPAEGPAPDIGALAAGDRAFYAIVSDDSGTRLVTSPLFGNDWHPVPGVALPDRGGGDVVAAGPRVHVALNAVHRSHGYWATSEGTAWHAARPPCPVHADPDLGLAAGTVYALCSARPGMGDMVKQLVRSTAGRPFTPVGRAPDAGITTGFAVASPSVMAVTAVGRGAALVHRGVEGGAVWDTPVVLPGAPLHDLGFTDARHGTLVWGRPDHGDGRVYRTDDGGGTWTPLSFE
ncbi:hypothetical protein [Actinophytocola glycyrrhizae]|uniref:Uncharacterized protein n=1 Tax=Actinophytocola glycyrrhizae TaxID=2044873 RepID=A0ABV9S5Q0_9PSEU